MKGVKLKIKVFEQNLMASNGRLSISGRVESHLC